MSYCSFVYYALVILCGPVWISPDSPNLTVAMVGMVNATECHESDWSPVRPDLGPIIEESSVSIPVAREQ